LQGNRADRRGAARLMTFFGVVALLSWIVGAHHSGDLEGEIGSFIRRCGVLALVGAVIWMIYVALEPYVRRFWPDSLLGWSRLLTGHVRDPRVGRDVLIGMIFGVALTAGNLARVTLFPALGYPGPRPIHGDVVTVLADQGTFFSLLLLGILGAIEGALVAVLMVVLLRLVLRWKWLAFIVASFLLSFNFVAYMTGTPWLVVIPLISGAVMTFVAVRFGLLPLVVTRYVWGVMTSIPVTLETSHWAAVASNWTLTLLIGLAVLAFYASRAGQPLFGAILKE
jgi:hypothetical protein